MSGNLLNNDNKTNYLFKKENYVIQSTLNGFGLSSVPERNFAGEIFGSKSIVFNENILSEDISKNTPLPVGVTYLTDGPAAYPNVAPFNLIPAVNDTTWVSDVSNQTISTYDLGNFNSDLDYLRFYKRVYLEPVDTATSCPSTWWLNEDYSKDAGPDNNLLSNMIPAGIGKSGTTFTPIVEFYNGSTWVTENAGFYNSSQDSANWSIDYATGILTLNVSNSHLQGISYSLDADPAKNNVETCRPRISYMRYVGPLGGGGGGSSGGSGGSGGGISDASYNELKDDITDISANLVKYLFNVPEAVTDFSYNEVIDVNGIPHAILTWTNPLQKCSAFEFYHIDESGIGTRDQTYKPDADGIATTDIGIWDTIKRSMNKLPFHERIHLQYQQYNPNNNFAITSTPHWTNIGEAQIAGSNGLTTSSNSSKTVYPIFKDITRADIFTDGTVNSPSLTNGLTSQDIVNGSTPAYLSTSKKTYTNKNTLDSSKVYRFRIALDNKACIDDNSDNNANNNDRDISNNLNWAYVPSSGYIELGSYGPAPAPSNIRFISGEDAFDPTNSSSSYSGTIKVDAGPSSTSGTTPVMDVSFNTAFSSSSPLSVEYGFDISGSQLLTSKQVGTRNNSSITNYNYSNENSFTYSDLSYNSQLIKTPSHSVDCLIINQQGWNYPSGGTITSDFANGIALPEYTYDISNVYMLNDKKDYPPGIKAITNYSVYAANFLDESSYATPQQTSLAIFANANYMDEIPDNTISPPTNSGLGSVDPGYDIILTNVPFNYYGNTNELKEVRDNDLTTRYAVFVGGPTLLNINFKPGTFASTQNFSNSSDVNFITCPQPTSRVGTDIVNQTIANYKMSFDYDDAGQQPKNDSVDVNITGYPTTGTAPFTFPQIESNTGSVVGQTLQVNIEIHNEDPTGNVSTSGSSRLQQQFGGYYNLQKVIKTSGVRKINSTDIGDVSLRTNAYTPYEVKLSQTLLIQSNPAVKEQKIEVLIGIAPTLDVVPPLNTTTFLGVATNAITTSNRLFGAAMPNNNLEFIINNFTISQINRNWIWKDGTNLMDLDFNYYHSKTTTASALLKNLTEDWDAPTIANGLMPTQIPSASQSKNWVVTENLTSNSPVSPLVGTYDYSRKGNENETTSLGDEQFKIDIVCKNNLYSTQSPNTQEFTVTYRSNDVLSWRYGTGSKNTLWWDYTYKGLSISNGDLPSGFVTISDKRSGSSSVNSKLQLQKKTVNLFQQTNPVIAGGYHVLGGASTASGGDQSWYDTDYDHSEVDLSDNQLLWSDGSFRCGGPSSSVNPSKNDNIFNPYIDYDTHYFSNNLNLLPRHHFKFDKGENWTNYTVASGDGFSSGASSVPEVYNGKYKWLLVRLSWNPPATYNVNSNPWSDSSQIEVYVSQSGAASKTNRLTLGTHYVMWICAVGSGLSGQNVKLFTDVSNISRKRTGWLDCQRKKPNTSNYGDGEGCMDKNAYTNNQEYKFTIPTLTNNQINSISGVDERVTDIFLRIGILNSNDSLNNTDDSYYNNKKIANISVKLNA
jgi:hypothetical protein